MLIKWVSVILCGTYSLGQYFLSQLPAGEWGGKAGDDQISMAAAERKCQSGRYQTLS